MFRSFGVGGGSLAFAWEGGRGQAERTRVPKIECIVTALFNGFGIQYFLELLISGKGIPLNVN